ncbi:MAG: stage 0 sporulation protein [Anaeroplasmataceae bacterium]|nr:stage 0 sporulation protein [Anaeroplasmataceae bacterium]MDE5867430.1 stage 0 sporulation protein [Anaeroplasmataceae bacterium]
MKAIRVRFKPVGKQYYFSTAGIDLKNGDEVIVNTVRGLELGFCVGEIFDIEAKDLTSELKDIVRVANDSDRERYAKNKSEEAQIVSTTKKYSKELDLQIKVLEAEYTLDRAKLIIYFESENRVDFRDLVKKLAETYHTRIELRQVGSRDGAKVFGGIGPCGLIVCCKTFITEFENVSVKMAKNQNLSLNPVKISGNCGKLLCCINYENELYRELRKLAPDIGDIVRTADGPAKILSCDVLNRNCKVRYIEDENKFGYLKLDEVEFVRSMDKHRNDEDDD